MTDKADIAALREAALKATQGEWWQDVVETEGSYGDPDNGGEGFHSYAVYGPDNNSLLDMTNSTAAIIQREDDGDYHQAWDEVGRRNAEYIALANPATILSLLDQLEAERQRADERAKENYGNKCKVENCMSTIADLEAELTALKAKLANPVVLPTRKNAGFYSDEEFSNKDLAAIYNCAILELKKKIQTAGFTTVKGES